MATMIELETHVEAPVDVVFGSFSDVDAFAEAVPDIVRVERLTDGPVGLGTRFRETRVMFGRETTETLEFTEWDPPRRFTIGGESCGTAIATTFSFAPAGPGATDVRLAMSARALTGWARVMMILCGWMMKGTMRKVLANDLERMKAAVEGRGA